MVQEQGLSLPDHLHQLISTLSSKLVSLVSLQFHQQATSSYEHYHFNIGDLCHVFQVNQFLVALFLVLLFLIYLFIYLFTYLFIYDHDFTYKRTIN